jgi:SAM-dependent methyltransferase
MEWNMKQKSQVHDTKESGYTDILRKKQLVWWKRLLDVQAPYRWNLQKLNPGYTLDIGCGIGRNLMYLHGRGIGIDHNLQSVEIANSRGLTAFTPETFTGSGFDVPDSFDTILLAHVAEHMTEEQGVKLLEEYIHFLKPTGRLIVITPQEAGYRSDDTHVEFIDFAKIRNIAGKLNLSVTREYSFPFPRLAGNIFTYNEFVSISTKANNP